MSFLTTIIVIKLVFMGFKISDFLLQAETEISLLKQEKLRLQSQVIYF